MQRRRFLSLLGAGALAPVLPVPVSVPARAAVQAGYTRYMYGLAVFQARTAKGAITAVDLMARLGVTGQQANAMMGEMTRHGVLSALTGSARTTGAALPRKPYVRKILRQIADHTNTDINTQTNTATSPAHPNIHPPLNRITPDAPTSGDYSHE